MAMIDNMFAHANSAAEKADEVEKLKESLEKSRRDQRSNARFGDDERMLAKAKLQGELKKSLPGLNQDERVYLASMLDEMQDLRKDVTIGQYPGVGSPGNLAPYDLEGPAKFLVPRATPILNSTARVKGVGSAREYRRILGIPNAGQGGVPDLDAFLNTEVAPSTSDPRFQYGNLSLKRGPKISYAMDVHRVSYTQMSVSDSVSYAAQFGNLGFENSIDLSNIALLWAHKLAEEKALLFGRGSTAMGYSGNFGGGVTPTAATATASGTGSSIPAATYQVATTIRAGVGESISTNVASPTVVAAGNNLVVTAPAPAAGAYGTNVYATTAGVTYFVGTISPSVTTAVTFTQLGNAMANAAPYATDTTSNMGYDGLLTVLTTPGVSGYVGAAAGSIATNGLAAINTALTAMYAANLADPDVVYVDPVIRGAISKWILGNAAGAANYRFTVDHNEAGHIASGALVASIFNPVTGKSLRLEAHPYMPYGCAVIQSETLPETVPNSGVGATSQIVSVQEYMSQAWTPVQFSYDFSTYWQGTLVHYAPAWSGALTGLTP